MSQSLYYFVSSLPALNQKDVPYFTHETYIAACRDALADSAIVDAIAEASLTVPAEKRPSKIAAINAWYAFETFFRNITSQARTAKRAQVNAPTRETAVYDAFVAKRIQDGFSGMPAAEREMMYDQIRWEYLDELAAGHQFDADVLAIYALKLLLLERRASRRLEPGLVAYKDLVEMGVKQAQGVRKQNELA